MANNTGIALIGCGYVADFYISTLNNYPHLEVLGVMDRDRARMQTYSQKWGIAHQYGSLQEILDDDRVKLVLNLTNPRSHFDISKACLLAGKHVYSEKPLAMKFEEARELVELAESRGLRISCAPCSMLSETAQTVKQALDRQEVGKVYLTYADIDDGLIHRDRYRTWTSPAGVHWPYKDEFETGCTLEHAAYWITWLVWFFGRVERVTSFARCVVPDKKTDVPLEITTPDFSVACLEFASGMVARLTCSIVAPHDRSMTIVGEEGFIRVEECWDFQSPVLIERPTRLRRWGSKYPLLRLYAPGVAPDKYPLVKGPKMNNRHKLTLNMDFARGVAELAAAISENRESRISARFALHINEVVLTIQNRNAAEAAYVPVSTF